jgi:hypothetical protein
MWECLIDLLVLLCVYWSLIHLEVPVALYVKWLIHQWRKHITPILLSVCWLRFIPCTHICVIGLLCCEMVILRIIDVSTIVFWMEWWPRMVSGCWCVCAKVYYAEINWIVIEYSFKCLFFFQVWLFSLNHSFFILFLH